MLAAVRVQNNKIEKKAKFLRSQILVIRAALVSVSLTFGSHSCTVNATVGDWPSGSTVCFTPMLFFKVLNAKLGNSMCHFQVFGMTRPGVKP